ncbi:helix-turn-helix domain-containing protein [Streptomyces sp. NPDC054802]
MAHRSANSSIESPRCARETLARCESDLRERRGAERQREAGPGPEHDLVFTDGLLVTLIRLRTGLTYAALVELYGIARSTVPRAIGEIRPLPASIGWAGRPSADQPPADPPGQDAQTSIADQVVSWAAG